VDRTRPLPHPVAGGPLVASLLIDTPTGSLGSGREIVADADTKTFSKAWKNGVWHCLEPVSFDLVDGSSIHAKAHRYTTLKPDKV
jgi:hypothetical protein